MEKEDHFTLELERAIYNFRLAGDDGEFEPVFNAMNEGIAHDMKVIVPSVQSRQGETLIFTSQSEASFGGFDTFKVVPISDVISAGPRIWEGIRTLRINPYNLAFTFEKELLKLLKTYFSMSFIQIFRCSVTNVHVGAIVNAANSTLLGGGGVDGAIHRLAGPALKAECRKFGGCKTGAAVITKSYNIDYVDAIIHTVGPIYSGSTSDRMDLVSCYQSSIELAYKNGITSIAFPCISTGAYGYPLQEACMIAVFSMVEWFDRHPDVAMNVYFCCFRPEEYAMYRSILIK